jgi:hypothetical protein
MTMADATIKFDSSKPRIALVVRGKVSAEHHPDKSDQHADVILADGSPLGFYGEGNGASGNRIGMSMQGKVYDYETMRIERPYYVSVDSAVSNRVISTVLLINVTASQAAAFDKGWKAMALSPGVFNIVGGNCSTHASASLIEAGLLTDGIPGLDTPDRLYGQLVATLKPGALQSISGYIGFEAHPKGGFNLVVKPHLESPAVNRPNAGTSGSLSTLGST